MSAQTSLSHGAFTSIVGSWPVVICPAWYVPQMHFDHLDTSVSLGGRHASGQTLWWAASAKGTVGIAWEWVRFPGGEIALADPFGLTTNLRLVGLRGEALTLFELMLPLNEMVQALPWQQAVQQALQRAGN